MAGLQQYNFFPTDFFYPRPHPSPSTSETASAKPTVVPMQTPKEETNQQRQQRTPMIKVPPPSHAVVLKPKTQSPFDKKLSTHSMKPLSWALSLEEKKSDDF
uniref:Uncharacterized protein n=1 Tax=Cajanus cajan TaxID=3821 RepID=A0A151U306_CAJCA|nr:hypothetical protein KK1_006313 [Cajanus cajan]